MAVGDYSIEFLPVPGVSLAATACGIKSASTDLVMLALEEGSETAGVFTQSSFAAAPVLLSRRHLTQSSPRYFIINSGNANAAVGDLGYADALKCCEAVAELTGVSAEEVLPFSTGVIGERLPYKKIINGIPSLVGQLDEQNWLKAAGGIMTTDTRPKITSRQIRIGDQACVITGIAKGSGMIQPNMATMLAYLATDADIESPLLKELLLEAVEYSFNRITVDSDTSTNDSVMLSATGKSNYKVSTATALLSGFREGLKSLCLELAQGIVKDAEGATKFVEVQVKNGASQEDCLKVAYSIANSPLVKTAIYASDANWGRIVMAIGKAGVDVPAEKVDVLLGDTYLLRSGQKDPEYTEAIGTELMASTEIVIKVDLNSGTYKESVWTSDLSHDYVKINADYRT